MLKDTTDLSSQPVIVGQQSPATSWLDESWQISMNKKTAPRKHGSAQSDKLDLCAICMYADECMYRSTAARPKIYCELFDVDTKAFAPREDGDPSLQNGGDQPLDLAGGLCCNCENRNVCTIRRKNGNVWHCEEYR